MKAAQQSEHFDVVNYEDDPRISKGSREFLKVLNSPSPPELEKLSPEDARQVLVKAQASAVVDYSGIEESEKTIDADDFSIKLDIVRPEGVTEKLPVFVFVHGGGWVLGDYPTHRRLVRDLVVETGYAAVFVNYTPTPDKVFPTQINEIYAATKWVAENGDEINVEGKNMAIAGNSVGGNMAAVTAIKAIENGGPEIRSLVLFWPVTDTKTATGSYQEFGEARFLTKPLMEWMFGMYASETELKNDYYIAPIKAPDEILAKLPPTLIQVGESDILHDEDEAFGRKLDELGVEVTTIRYNGMIHDFGLLNALAEEPATKSLIRHAAAELKNRLG
ncbi:MAG: alpha/beta hydrolase [Saprospiraceae bacterium]|nr:alpha/beta hydrolase [Pyrinomonadaceae bacterium]